MYFTYKGLHTCRSMLHGCNLYSEQENIQYMQYMMQNLKLFSWIVCPPQYVFIYVEKWEMKTLFPNSSLTYFNKACKCDESPWPPVRLRRCNTISTPALLFNCTAVFFLYFFPPKTSFCGAVDGSVTGRLAVWLLGIRAVYPVGLERLMVANGSLCNISIKPQCHGLSCCLPDL